MLAKIEKHIREHGFLLCLHACEISLSSGIFQLLFLRNEYALHLSISFEISQVKECSQNHWDKV